MKISALSFVFIALSFSQAAVASDETVRTVFEDYRTAILNADAEPAYQLVDSNTKAYYTQMLDAILFAHKDEIQAMSPSNKIVVVQSRHRIPTEELAAFDGETYFKYAVANGWIGQNSVSGIALANIVINGDIATSKIKKGQQTAPFGFTFRKESEGWKIDLMSMMPMIDMAFKQVIKNSGMEEDEFIFNIVESLSGRKVDASIWNPPLEK